MINVWGIHGMGKAIIWLDWIGFNGGSGDGMDDIQGRLVVVLRASKFRAIYSNRDFFQASPSLAFNTHTLLNPMASVELDAKRFHRRARFLISQWKVSPCSFYSSLGFLLESFFSPFFGRRSRKDPFESVAAFTRPTNDVLSFAWQSPSNANLFQQTDAILLLIGDDDYDNPYRKSVTAEVSERRGIHDVGVIQQSWIMITNGFIYKRVYVCNIDLAFGYTDLSNFDYAHTREGNICMQCQER